MHKNSIGFLVAAMACAAATTYAATPSGTITRQSLISSGILNKLSVGADITYIDRGFESGGIPLDWEARVYGGYVGYDVLPWLTLFASLGGSQIKESDTDGYWSPGTKWSLGAAPNIWEGDLRRPSFMAGKISLSAFAEVSEYESSTDGASADWREYAAALLIRYEVFEDAPWSADSVTSLRLSAGPIVSKVRGHAGGHSFSEGDLLGWIASVEWFIAPTFSIAGGAEVFDHTSVSGSVRLHF